jgi:hypothetical protein
MVAISDMILKGAEAIRVALEKVDPKKETQQLSRLYRTGSADDSEEEITTGDSTPTAMNQSPQATVLSWSESSTAVAPNLSLQTTSLFSSESSTAVASNLSNLSLQTTSPSPGPSSHWNDKTLRKGPRFRFVCGVFIYCLFAFLIINCSGKRVSLLTSSSLYH